MSIQSAALYSDALAEFRSVYTSEVVNRLQNNGLVEFRHDYQKFKNTLPLPATLSMQLGQRIGESNSGALSSLYSPYPFPWREVGGGISSDFKRKAWQALTNRQESYYEFTQIDGKKVIRFATADVMREACVSCHNTHPDSPKTDWVVGDVRGVLEVIQPIESISEQARQNLNAFHFLIGLIVCLGLGSLSLFISLQRRNKTELTNKLNKTKQAVKATQQDLAKSEKLAALGLVSVGIAHEINQPLAAAKLTLSLIEKKIATVGLDLGNKFERLNRQIDRVGEIIVQLNEASVKQDSYEFEVADVNLAITNSIDWLKEQLESEKIEYTIKLSNETMLALANRLEVERVLINIITNSIHALREIESSKEIDLNSYLNGQQIIVEISDNGSGVEAENINKIFDPFFTTKPVGEGMGMGLAMCYGIITKYQGNLEYLMPSNGIGARFRITIPRYVKITKHSKD
jgi:signal transduction histidine kinase